MKGKSEACQTERSLCVERRCAVIHICRTRRAAFPRSYMRAIGTITMKQGLRACTIKVIKSQSLCTFEPKHRNGRPGDPPHFSALPRPLTCIYVCIYIYIYIYTYSSEVRVLRDDQPRAVRRPSGMESEPQPPLGAFLRSRLRSLEAVLVSVSICIATLAEKSGCSLNHLPA